MTWFPWGLTVKVGVTVKTPMSTAGIDKQRGAV
jgi:hypothetical protein